MPKDFKRAFRLDRSSRADARTSVDDELEHHIELFIEELLVEGWKSEDASAEARRRFAVPSPLRSESSRRTGRARRRSDGGGSPLQGAGVARPGPRG